jgi:DNA polymerase-3 subunit alpha
MAEVEKELQNKNAARFRMAGVILKKQEKVSAKSGNKFAFLQVSDPVGVWEGMVFSETLARCRNSMNAGDHVLLSVDVDVKEGEMRFLVQDAQPLDDALADSVQQVRITIDARTDIKKLHEGLKGCDVGGICPLHIYAPMPDGGQVRLVIPGLWQIPPMKRRALYKIKGVRSVEEL